MVLVSLLSLVYVLQTVGTKAVNLLEAMSMWCCPDLMLRLRLDLDLSLGLKGPNGWVRGCNDWPIRWWCNNYNRVFFFSLHPVNDYGCMDVWMYGCISSLFLLLFPCFFVSLFVLPPHFKLRHATFTQKSSICTLLYIVHWEYSHVWYNLV